MDTGFILGYALRAVTDEEYARLDVSPSTMDTTFFGIWGMHSHP
jgi:hypothetical protein